jgi:hypothetical protein
MLGQSPLEQVNFPKKPEKILHPLLSQLEAMAGTEGIPREFEESGVNELVYNLFADIKDEPYTVTEITRESCDDTTKLAVKNIEDFLKNKHYLIFNDGVSILRYAIARQQLYSVRRH